MHLTKMKNEKKSEYRMVLSRKINAPAAFLVLTAVCFALYAQTFDNPFHFDDFKYVHTYTFKNIEDIPAFFKDFNTRALTFLSFNLNWQLHGKDSAGFYLVNILIHIVNSFLVFLIIRKLISTDVVKNDTLRSCRDWAALAGALIFAVHPLQTQAVAYIYQRLASMAAMFYLMSFYFYLKSYFKNGIKSFLLIIASLLSFLLGAFSKEIIFTLPAALIFLELFFLRKNGRIRYFRILLLLIFSSAGIAAVWLYKDINLAFTDDYGRSIPLSGYLYTQTDVVLQYIRMVLIPYGQNISHFVPIYKDFFRIEVIGSTASHLLVISAGIYLFFKNRLASFGILWFYLTLAVESSIIVLADPMFEHRVYLPLAGYCFLLPSLIFGWKIFEKRISYPAVLISALIVLLSFTAFLRVGIWNSGMELWTDAAEKSPQAERPFLMRGRLYLEQKKYDRAIEDFKKSLEINPVYKPALGHLGYAYFRAGMPQKAIMAYSRIILADKKNGKAYENRGTVYAALGKYHEALADFDKSFRYGNRSGSFVKKYIELCRAADRKEKMQFLQDYLKNNK